VEDDGTAAANITVSGSQAVQAGTGNIQHNWLTRTPLDVATFAALSPHAAVTRIRALAHDDAVDLLARAPADDLTDKLKALLLADEPTAVAILADLSPRKADQLIAPHRRDFPWLAHLPTAADAIAEHAVSLQWHHDAETGWLERAARSPYRTEGYFRRYKHGRVYWSDFESTTCRISGSIAECHQANGGSGGEFGFPLEEEVRGKTLQGTKGSTQVFEGGWVHSSSFGAYGIPEKLEAKWGEWLGFAASAAGTRDGVTIQLFEGGVAYSSDQGAFTVRAEIAECADQGWHRLSSDGERWLPASAEEDVSASATTGRVQRFKNTTGTEMAVYSSGETGVHCVVGERLALYEKLGGPASHLGFPISAVITRYGGWTQEFEHGTIYDHLGYGPTSVPAETFKLVGRLNLWPMSEEKSVGGNADERIQFFDNGIVTVRHGKREIWVHLPPRP
jgi:hypothetical protein